MMPNVLIVIGDASDTLGTLYPSYHLIEAGIEPVVIGSEKRPYGMGRLHYQRRFGIFRSNCIRLPWYFLLRWSRPGIHPLR